jgi:chromosomal replication initiator protein
VPSRPTGRKSTPPVVSEQALVDAVIPKVGAARYGLWFRGQARFIPSGDTVVVAVRNQQALDWLQTFEAAVREAILKVCGPKTALSWVVDEARVVGDGVSSGSNGVLDEAPAEDGKGKGRKGESNLKKSELFSRRKVQEQPTPVDPRKLEARKPGPRKLEGQKPDPRQPEAKKAEGTKPQLDLFGDPVQPGRGRGRRGSSEASIENGIAASRPGRRWKSLTDFVVGPSNRMAHSAAISTVERPGDEANPLVIHGPIGTGKTHLLEGIYAAMKRKSDERPTIVTAEEFTTRFVHASQHGKMSGFRRQFRECTALLIDDLHSLATRKATQAEFLHTFDTLVSDGRQVVATMDCHPRLADELMPELVDRMLGGAVWGLLPPDESTRLEILRKKSVGATPVIPDPVLKLIAGSLRGNVRELEGAVNSVRHYARVTTRAIDQSLVREALGDLLRHAVRVVTVADVDAAVCSTLRMPAGSLQSKSRAWSVTHPRMVAIYLCRKHTAATYGEISKHFGAKTHSTAVASEKKVRVWLDKEQTVVIGDREWRSRELIDRIERELQK